MIFFLAVYGLPNYYIRLADSNKMLSRHEEDVIASDFYSPMLFEFEQADNGDMYLRDIIKDKSLTLKNDIIEAGEPAQGSANEFGIVFNGISNFYIVKDDRCLEAEVGNLASLKMTKLRFAKCDQKSSQLWEVLFSGDRKINKHHVFIPDPKKHLQRHNHIFFDRRNPSVKKHSAFMIYHPERSVEDTVAKGHDVVLKVSENYEASVYPN